MKLIYLANIRLPTEKAHGTQIMKMCEAFADQGAEVELLVPTRQNSLAGEPFAYYGTKKNFSIRYLRAADTLGLPVLGFYLQSWAFAFAAVRAVRAQKFDVVFGREELPLWLVSRFIKKPVVWESHLGNWNFSAKRLAKVARTLVVISQGLKSFYAGRGVPANKIIVAHDGVDLSDFANPESKQAARTRLGLPQDKKIAMYIGRLDGWKGVDVLLEASKLLPGVQTVLIGGDKIQVAELSARYPAALFLGYKPYTELPDNQQAADILVLPNTAKDKISSSYTSPMKLFSYMVSGVPMVASNLPSIREVTDETSAVLVKPDDAQALADGIQLALAEGAPRAAAAKKLVERYTWAARAELILKNIDHDTPAR